MAHRKVYTPEFKQQAVQLAQQPGNTNQGIASDLGISQSALSSWIKAAKEHGSLAFPGQGIARLTPEQETIKRLERELVWTCTCDAEQWLRTTTLITRRHHGTPQGLYPRI